MEFRCCDVLHIQVVIHEIITIEGARCVRVRMYVCAYVCACVFVCIHL